MKPTIFWLAASLLLLPGGCVRKPEQAVSAPVPRSTAGSPAAALEPLLAAAGFEAPAGMTAAGDFRLDSLEGTAVSLSSLRGRPVLLNFWATWCPPCRAELPSLGGLYRRFQGRGLALLGIDLREEPAVVKAFAGKEGIPFPVLLDREGTVGTQYGVTGIPTTYLISASGTVLGRIVGARVWDAPEVTALLESVLGK